MTMLRNFLGFFHMWLRRQERNGGKHTHTHTARDTFYNEKKGENVH